MAKKVVKTTKTGRGSDQFMVRMPPGMRPALAEEAERNGRSMNAEIVGRLAHTFEERLSSEGYIVLGKRLEASVEHLDELLFHIRDIDLEAFIADQQSKGTMLTRTQAIRLILRTYLSEKGFVRGPRARQSNESMPKE
jgi:Arc-like DNA binding domain